jgi:hypothetical protein
MVSVQVTCDLEDPLATYVIKAGSITASPKTYQMNSLEFLQQFLLNPGTAIFVVELDKHDIVSKSTSDSPAQVGTHYEGQVIGWAVWTRHGKGRVVQN